MGLMCILLCYVSYELGAWILREPGLRLVRAKRASVLYRLAIEQFEPLFEIVKATKSSNVCLDIIFA